MLEKRIDITQRAPRACVAHHLGLGPDRAFLEPDRQVQPWIPPRAGAPKPSNSARSPASLRSTVSPLRSMVPYSATTGTVTRPRTALRRWLVLGRPGGPHPPADDGALLDLGDLGRQRPLGVLVVFQNTSTTSPTFTTTCSYELTDRRTDGDEALVDDLDPRAHRDAAADQRDLGLGLLLGVVDAGNAGHSSSPILCPRVRRALVSGAGAARGPVRPAPMVPPPPDRREER